MITNISGAMAEGTRMSAVTTAITMRTLAAMIVKMAMITATDTKAASLTTRMLVKGRAPMAAVPKAIQTSKPKRFRTEKASTRGAYAMMRKRRSGNEKPTTEKRQTPPRNAPDAGHAPRA